MRGSFTGTRTSSTHAHATHTLVTKLRKRGFGGKALIVILTWLASAFIIRAYPRLPATTQVIIRIVCWPSLQTIGSSILRQSVALSTTSARANKMKANMLYIHQAMMIMSGRIMIYMVHDQTWTLVTTIVCGVFEVARRSSIVVVDDYFRRRIFGANVNRDVRAKQIKIWTQDICGAQLIELSAIPVHDDNDHDH